MVLIITNRTDVTSDLVIKELNKRNYKFFRLNTDEYPTNLFGSFKYFKNNKFVIELFYLDRKKKINLKRINSVLFRRPVSPVIDSTLANKNIKQYCIDECYDFLRGIWHSLDCCYWISKPNSIKKAEHKIYQLKIAFECGFKIPETIITNNPTEVLNFKKHLKSDIIIKPLYSGFIESSARNNNKMIYTTKLNDSDLNKIETIKFAPAIFQRYIEKTCDLRVTVIRDKVFAVKIESKKLPSSIPDWRYAELNDLKHSIFILPPKIKKLCIELVKSLSLEFGAIDFAIDTNNNFYFLEINPNGQWAWLEHILNIPLTQTIVDALIKGQ